MPNILFTERAKGWAPSLGNPIPVPADKKVTFNITVPPGDSTVGKTAPNLTYGEASSSNFLVLSAIHVNGTPLTGGYERATSLSFIVGETRFGGAITLKEGANTVILTVSSATESMVANWHRFL